MLTRKDTQGSNLDYKHDPIMKPRNTVTFVLRKMKSLMLLPRIVVLLCTSSVVVLSSVADVPDEFMQCMSTQLSTQSLQGICSPGSCGQYSRLLLSSQQNPRWVDAATSKPLYIVTPSHESEVHASVICSRNHGLRIRVRSGGHDYEGLSYTCNSPFVLIDLASFRSIEVNIAEETALVQTGATIGELYYEIAKKSRIHGFPAGICPSVGVGGHFSGGGFGTMVRKHGLAADQIIDARIIDASGRILDRKLMGEDLFWAIRGGGAASFGIVMSWKVKLVQVPATVTVFSISKQLDDPSSLRLVQTWQKVGYQLSDDLFIRVLGQNTRVIRKVSYNSLFLGEARDLLSVMDQSFPDLGLRTTDCAEMSWIESVLYFAGYKNGEPLEKLLDRVSIYKSSFKGKSDFVTQPLSDIGLETIWDMLRQEGQAYVIIEPFGGKMGTISEAETPFPHRKGTLYNIQYLVKWDQSDRQIERHLTWMRMLYERLTPHVSKSPRAAYLNYRDLDLGMNKGGNTSYSEASAWGSKYFKGNFERLVRVKTMIDPDNFFRDEQSIPPHFAFKRR